MASSSAFSLLDIHPSRAVAARGDRFRREGVLELQLLQVREQVERVVAVTVLVVIDAAQLDGKVKFFGRANLVDLFH